MAEKTVGGSRAAKRRAKKRGDAPASAAGPTSASPAPTAAAAPPAEPDTPARREWTAPLPLGDEPLTDGLQIALDQARLIHGRKYRYGATLLAGDDHIPLRSGSNKKVFNRDNIHAEASALKGCVVPRGKDMMIVRLAPAPAPSEEAVAAARGGLCRGEKFLNARPCEACEAKMVSRGLRRCFFTLPNRELGVIELQLAATRPPRMEGAEELHAAGEQCVIIDSSEEVLEEASEGVGGAGDSPGEQAAPWGLVAKFEPDLPGQAGGRAGPDASRELWGKGGLDAQAVVRGAGRKRKAVAGGEAEGRPLKQKRPAGSALGGDGERRIKKKASLGRCT